MLAAYGESSIENARRILEDLEQQSGRVREIETEIAGGMQRLKDIEHEKAALQEKRASAENVRKGCRMKLDSREGMLTGETERLRSLEQECSALETRIRILTDMQRDYEGYSKAVRSVMREREHQTLRGIHGPVSGLLRTDRETALAVETALGSSGQNIVVDTQQDARLAIEMLQRRDAGRATFLPLDTIRGSRMHDAPEDDPGFVGIASDLVQADAKYSQIVLNLLGRTVVAERLTDAIRMSKKSGNRLRIVTLDGQMIHAGGSMTGGSSVQGSGILSRASELDELRQKAGDARKKQEAQQQQVAALQRTVETRRT